MQAILTRSTVALLKASIKTKISDRLEGNRWDSKEVRQAVKNKKDHSCTVFITDIESSTYFQNTVITTSTLAPSWLINSTLLPGTRQRWPAIESVPVDSVPATLMVRPLAPTMKYADSLMTEPSVGETVTVATLVFDSVPTGRGSVAPSANSPL